MLIQLNNHSLADDLLHHFARSGFRAQSMGAGLVKVQRLDSLTKDREHREILIHLRVWEAVNPEATALIVS